MHFVQEVAYEADYKLQIRFGDDIVKIVDLAPYLTGEIFEPLRDQAYFKTVRVNPDVDTIVWENGADFSPDFLYEIGKSLAITGSVAAI